MKFPKKGYIDYAGDRLVVGGDLDTDERQFRHCDVDGDEDLGENQLYNLMLHFSGDFFVRIVRGLFDGFFSSHPRGRDRDSFHGRDR